ncbi:MAG: hypothetical protein IKB28_02905 [Clostridia bacterium]|nr:hypothetical protein [Clostridia bacterium]
MKRILMLLMAVVLVLSMASLVACEPETPEGGEETTTEAPSNQEETTTPEQEGTTQEPDPGVDEPTDLENAAEYVRQLYKDTTVTAADYTLVSSVKIGATTYEITWTVNTDKITVTVGEDGTVSVDVPDEAYEEIAYVLTATVKDAEGNTAVKEFNRTVPKFKVTTWEEYQAAEEGDNLIVQGIVVGINSKAAGNTRNHLFLLDESGYGGYYSYQMDVDPVADLGIEVGMTVRVAGPAAPYSGMMEIKGGIPTVVSTEIKSFEVVDITDKFVPETNFNELVGMPVVIKGVTIGGQELATATSQYLYFELNGVQSYVRTYVTDFPTTLTAGDKGTIDAAHAEKLGYTADVTGIMITYSGTPYLIPTSVDCFYNFALPERSDAEKVTLEKDNLTVDVTTFTENGEAELTVAGSTYPDVAISWASDSEYVTVDGGKLTITIPNETTNVKLTATLTLGGATETVDFEITLVASNFTIVPVTAPEAEVAYKMYLNQVKNGYGVFVCGGINQDRYLITSKAASEALDVYAEANGDGFSFYTMIDGAKKYINVTHNDAGKVAVLYQDEAISVYVYTEGINAWVTNVEGEADQYYLGTYSNFDTISASKTSYISAENTGVSQFPLQLVVLGDANMSADGNVITNAGVEIKEGVAYLMSMNQVKNGHIVYVCGGIDQDRYLITSEDKAAALQVFVEKTEEGYNFFTTIDGAKKYINVTTNDAGKVAILYQDAATSTYTYVPETNIWMTNLDGQDKYIGSYNNFDTMSASNTSYINAGNTGVAQFPMELVLAE